MTTYERLRKLFPKYYDGIVEIDELCKAYAELADTLIGCVNQYIANIFLTDDASIDYIEEIERFFGIVPSSSDSKLYRLSTIKAKYSDRVPYDIVRLNTMVDSIVGDADYKCIEHFNEMYVEIQLDGRDNITEEVIDTIKRITRNIVPAHIGILVRIVMNTWLNVLEKYETWSNVLANSWEDVLKVE